MTRARSTLRTILKSGVAVPLPGAYDRVSARLVGQLGFPLVSVPGSLTGIAMGVEEPLLTLTEMVNATAEVARHSGVPVITDAGSGFGPPEALPRCVIELENAGATAIHIEDEPFPVPLTAHQGVAGLISLDEFRQKVKTAVSARRDPGFILIARTNAAMGPGASREEAVRRLLAAKDAGAEAGLLVGIRDREGLSYFRQHLPDFPLMTVGATDLSVADYTALGYSVIFYPGILLHAAAEAMKETANALLTDGIPGGNLGGSNYSEIARELTPLRRSMPS
jgi:methylisocitrate lyase